MLLNANRLDSAELRFGRVADIGYLHDNPRLIATAAWGMARRRVTTRQRQRHAALDRHGGEHRARAGR